MLVFVWVVIRKTGTVIIIVYTEGFPYLQTARGFMSPSLPHHCVPTEMGEQAPLMTCLEASKQSQQYNRRLGDADTHYQRNISHSSVPYTDPSCGFGRSFFLIIATYNQLPKHGYITDRFTLHNAHRQYIIEIQQLSPWHLTPSHRTCVHSHINAPSVLHREKCLKFLRLCISFCLVVRSRT